MTLPKQDPTITRNTPITLGLVIVIFAAIVPPLLAGYAAWRDVKEDLTYIKLEMTLMRETDPWCKLDDKLYMAEFARQNGLKEVPHERVVTEKKLPQRAP